MGLGKGWLTLWRLPGKKRSAGGVSQDASGTNWRLTLLPSGKVTDMGAQSRKQPDGSGFGARQSPPDSLVGLKAYPLGYEM